MSRRESASEKARQAGERRSRVRSRWAAWGAAGIVLGALGGWAGVGRYDVSARSPHSAPVEWLLRSGMERSVRAHARELPAGTNSNDPHLAARAIGHYAAACAPCHAAPGQPRAPWMVLYPEPADLTRPEVVARWTDAELYWIIANGIKDTGMIALGPTHSEADLLAVTAFVRQLPRMSSERYRELASSDAAGGHEAGHHQPSHDGQAVER